MWLDAVDFCLFNNESEINRWQIFQDFLTVEAKYSRVDFHGMYISNIAGCKLIWKQFITSFSTFLFFSLSPFAVERIYVDVTGNDALN